MKRVILMMSPLLEKALSELRIFYGPGYRVYFVKQNSVVVILLSGGDKSSQQADIAKAKEIARQL